MIPSPAAPYVELLRSRAPELAEEIVARHYQLNPGLESQYGPMGRLRCLEDAQYHLRYLAEAIDADSPLLFVDYVDWAGIMLQGRNVPSADLRENLQCMLDSLYDLLPPPEDCLLSDIIQPGIDQLAGPPRQESEFGFGAHRQLALEYLDTLLRGDRLGAIQLIHNSLADGLSIKQLYLDVFQQVQYEIGWRWQTNQISVGQEHCATAITQLVMSQLYPQIMSTPKHDKVMVCACIGGDLHELGTRMLADLFELEGWDTVYLGANTPPAGIHQKVNEASPHLVALSTTMTYHLPKLRETIRVLRASGSTPILVGGRPFNLEPTLWKHVGADGFARNAADALTLANRLALGGSS